MIIVDTSVWIDYFGGKIAHHCDFLDKTLQQNQVGIFDVIFMDILQGLHHDEEYNTAKNALQQLPITGIINQHNAIIYADFIHQLHKQGLNTHPNKIMIAKFCIDNELPLLFSDDDFLPFCKHFGLKSALTLGNHK